MSVLGGGFAWRVGGGVAVALALAFEPSCASKFDGPYACLPDFASCTTQDGCETKISEDATNCGVCGNACPLGGVCIASTCQTGATVFSPASAGAPQELAVNGSGVFWITNVPMNGTLVMAPLSGGAPRAVLPASSNAFYLALDDANVYFSGQVNVTSGMTGTMPVFALWKQPIAGGTPTGLAPLTGGDSTAAALLVEGGSVIWLDEDMGMQSEPLDRVATTGGTVSAITTFDGVSQQSVVADSHNVYAAVTSNGPCTIQAVPLTGGAPVTIAQTEGDGCPAFIATDGVSVYWAGEFETQQQNDDNGQPSNVCVLSIEAVPVAGGAVSTLASLSTYEVPTSIATDGVSVYFSTYQNVRKVPVGGGAVVPVAGSFGAPAVTPTTSQSGNGIQCGSTGGSPNNDTISIALGPSDVYIADGFNGDILKAPK
jgi:hypothetical protein